MIPNPHGTAPGIDLEIPRGDRPSARFFALPGVPAEMRRDVALYPAPVAGSGPAPA